MSEIQFANPEYLYGLIIIPLLIIWYVLRDEKQHPVLNVSTFAGFAKAGFTMKPVLRHLLFIFRMLAIGLLIIAIARPQSSASSRDSKTEGIDIVIALDISGSMLAEDFKPNRLAAAKETAKEFINKRINDRIGLVVFASTGFTQCPLTIDHDVIKNLLGDIKTDMIPDGTAIGNGLGTSVKRLKDSKAKSKVVILLTDGINNTGNISPLTAAEIAKTFNVKVYTIGIGTRGLAPYPFQTPFGIRYQNVDVQIDEKVLKEIAGLTGGNYYRATNKSALEDIYNKIDKLEKTRIEVTESTRYTEKFLVFAIAAAAFFVLELLLRLFVFRTIP